MRKHIWATMGIFSVLASVSACADNGASEDGATVTGDEGIGGMAAADGNGMVDGGTEGGGRRVSGNEGGHGVEVADGDWNSIGRAPQEGNGRRSLMDKAAGGDKGNGRTVDGRDRGGISGGGGEAGDDVGNGLTDSGTDIGG